MTLTYSVKELNLDGQIITSTYRGESHDDIIRLVRSKGHTPIKIEQQAPASLASKEIVLFKSKVKTSDIAIFCKQLHTMLHAGMPLITALEVLSEQSESKTIKETCKAMLIQVQKGEVLSVAMKAHLKVFPSMLINMVEAGELTGNLDEVLEKMSIHYNKETRINQKIKSAMMYPMFLSILAVVVVVFLLVYIMPTFTGMFESSGQALPAITQFMLNFSDVLTGYWYVIMAVLGLGIWGFKKMLAQPGGKRLYDKVLLKLPIVKGPIGKITTSRFTRTLSTLLDSGIPILQAMETSAKVTGNMVVIDGVIEINEDIKKGMSLSALLKKIDLFPPMMISMVSIGEESGALEEMLRKTADFYDEELEASLQRLVSLIEPAMILVMALVIGFIVVSMMMPMFDMLQAI